MHCIFSYCLWVMYQIKWRIPITSWSTIILSHIMFAFNTDSISGRLCCRHKSEILALSSTYANFFALTSLYFTIYLSTLILYNLSSRTGTSILFSVVELSVLNYLMGLTGSTIVGCAISSITLEHIPI